MRRHPSHTMLSRYHDEELPPRLRARVAAHLLRCAECRDEVAWLGALGEAARGLGAPALPSHLEAATSARRAGHAVPLRSARVRRGRRFVPAAIAAVLLLGLTLSSLLFTTRELEAEKSELRVLPEAPLPGGRVEIEYRATSRLAEEARLVVRARLRTPESADDPAPVVLAELARHKDRVFRGAFVLPDSVVYAVLAVEDPAAREVDHREEEWYVLAHAADGRPLLGALVQRMRDVRMRNSRLALEAAREMVRLYPDSAVAWQSLYYAESGDAPEAVADSLRREHRERTARFSAELERVARPTASAMAGMVFYAGAVGDTLTQRHWRARLLADYPMHPSAVQQRVFLAAEAHRGDVPGFFAALERLWEEHGDASSQLAFTGFMTAMQRGDATMMRVWGRRIAASDAGWLGTVAQRWADRPELRDEAIPELRRYVASTDSLALARRPLHITLDAQRATGRRWAGNALGKLGKVLVARGETEAGLEALEQATATAWNPGLFRTVAETRLEIGDTTGALPLLARVAADPGTAPAFADSVRARLAGQFDHAAWDAALREGTTEMRGHMVRLLTNRPVRGDPRMVGWNGTVVDLRGPDGDETFVALWSRYCAPSLMQLGQLAALERRLASEGVRVVTVTDEAPSPELRAFLESKKLDFPVYFDPDRGVRRALESFGTPTYALIDRAGRIRFQSHGLDDVLRQLWIVRGGGGGDGAK